MHKIGQVKNIRYVRVHAAKAPTYITPTKASEACNIISQTITKSRCLSLPMMLSKLKPADQKQITDHLDNAKKQTPHIKDYTLTDDGLLTIHFKRKD